MMSEGKNVVNLQEWSVRTNGAAQGLQWGMVGDLIGCGTYVWDLGWMDISTVGIGEGG